MAETKKYARLAHAVRQTHRRMEDFRKPRNWSVKQYTGQNYADPAEGSVIPITLNVLDMYVKVVTRSLIAKDPRAIISSFQPNVRAQMRQMQTRMNRRLLDMNFADTMHQLVLDALFGPMGIAVVSLATPADAARLNWQTSAGRVFVSRVDFDDYVVDLNASDFSGVEYEGWRTRVPLEVVKKQYGSAAKDLAAEPRLSTQSAGDDSITNIGAGGVETEWSEYRDHVYLWHIWCPADGVVKTYSNEWIAGDSGADEEPLWAEKWIGPKTGPIHRLYYGRVPGNLMPIGPIAHLVDQHLNLNATLNKLVNQGLNQKSVLPYRGSDPEDVKRLMRAKDFEAFKCDNADTLQERNFGGPNAAVFQLFLALKQLMDWSAGNLSVMGGLSAQADTATQEKLMSVNSSRMTLDMATTTVSFTSELIRSLCWFDWHNPRDVYETPYPDDNSQSLITRKLPPLELDPKKPRGRLQIPWEELDIKVDPYSMQHQTPEMKLNFIMGLLKGLAPFTPIMAQQGYVPDFDYILKKASEYGDSPDVTQMYRVTAPMAPPGGGDQGGMMGGAPAEDRTYTRKSVAGQSDADQMAEIGNAMSKEAASGGGM